MYTLQQSISGHFHVPRSHQNDSLMKKIHEEISILVFRKTKLSFLLTKNSHYVGASTIQSQIGFNNNKHGGLTPFLSPLCSRTTEMSYGRQRSPNTRTRNNADIHAINKKGNNRCSLSWQIINLSFHPFSNSCSDSKLLSNFVKS